MPGAGAGPAGHDPVVTSEAVLPPADVAATLFDGQTLDFPLDDLDSDAANWTAVHPVDQEVELALLIPAGTIGSALDVGHTYRDVDIGAPSLQADVEDRTRQALRRPLARGDIRINRIEASAENRQLRVAVYYANLRSADPSRVLQRVTQF